MCATRIHAQRVRTASNVFQIDGHPFDIFGDFWYFIRLKKCPLISADISMRHKARIYIMIQLDLKFIFIDILEYKSFNHMENNQFELLSFGIFRCFRMRSIFKYIKGAIDRTH